MLSRWALIVRGDLQLLRLKHMRIGTVIIPPFPKIWEHHLLVITFAESKIKNDNIGTARIESKDNQMEYEKCCFLVDHEITRILFFYAKQGMLSHHSSSR